MLVQVYLNEDLRSVNYVISFAEDKCSCARISRKRFEGENWKRSSFGRLTKFVTHQVYR